MHLPSGGFVANTNRPSGVQAYLSSNEPVLDVQKSAAKRAAGAANCGFTTLPNVSHSRCDLPILHSITLLVFQLNALYDRAAAEPEPAKALDRQIRRVTVQLDQIYESAVAAGLALNVNYLTHSADGTAYTLRLTAAGFEYRRVG